MKAIICKTSHMGRTDEQPHPQAVKHRKPVPQWTVDIPSMNDLIKVISEAGAPVIVSVLDEEQASKYDAEIELEIYDDYRE